MMQVKVGDRVRRVSHSHHRTGSPMVVGSEWTVSKVDDEPGWFFVEGYDQLLSVKYFKLVPLDPSKVTVEITDWEDFRPGDVVVQNPDADGVEGAAFLVERHQPAPEPEWKPGSMVQIEGEAETVTATLVRVRDAWVNVDNGLSTEWLPAGRGVRPLVVIDPTRAKDALTRTGISDGWRDTVLEALGIES